MKPQDLEFHQWLLRGKLDSCAEGKNNWVSFTWNKLIDLNIRNWKKKLIFELPLILRITRDIYYKARRVQ